MCKLPILLNEWAISEWAYHYCRDVNNDSEVKNFITSETFVYYYCLRVENDFKMARKYIESSRYIKLYIKNIYNDPIIRLKYLKREFQF